MARGNLVLNIGTITEEECLTEELTEEDSISAVELPDVTYSENGTANCETSKPQDNTNGKGDAGDDDAGGDGGGDPDDDTGSFVELDRPSSLVEKEDVEDNISILTLMMRARTQAALCPSSSSPSTCHASAGMLKNLGTAAGGDKIRSRTSMRNTTRSLPGKCITELSLYNPAQGPRLADAFSLGIFLATDGATGDHIVYKINPGSPIEALNIKQQDRLEKINDLDVRDWSHFCLLEFVRNLSLPGGTDVVLENSDIPKTKPSVQVSFSVEYRRPGRVTLTPNSCPVTLRASSTLKLPSTAKEKVVLKLIGTSSSSRLRHVGVITRRLRAEGIPEGRSHLRVITTTETATLDFGPKEEDGLTECFRVHLFEREGLPSSSGSSEGLLAMVEAPKDRGFIYARDHDSVHLVNMPLDTSANVAMGDPRLFCMRQHSGGKSVVYFTNVATGQYLSASGAGLTLISKRLDEGCSSDLFFDLFKCQQHAEHADASC